MIQNPDNLNLQKTAGRNCLVCQDLLAHMGRFFDMLEISRRSSTSDWLTVNDIAKELKVSKSIVYRLVRNGNIKAIDMVDSNGKISQKGHYRIKKQWLNEYIESKKVNPSPDKYKYRNHTRPFPKVKNCLGL